MICQICRLNILDGNQNWGFHRPDYYTGNKSGDEEVQKCTFCSQLRQDVEDLIRTAPNSHTQQDSYYPTYRWTIRSSPSIRETQPNRHTTITFRPVTDQNLKQPGASSLKCPKAIMPTPTTKTTSDRLPTRTFYIFDAKTLTIPSSLSPTTDIIISPHNPHPSAGAQIHQWISTCITSHPRCSSSSGLSPANPPSFVPTRLIDITLTPSRSVHIINTTRPSPSGPFQKAPYVTLSHCWGTTPLLTLTASTLPQFTDPSSGIHWDDLPRTFREAIQVARELGVRYMWIDSLCIVQKSVVGLTPDGGEVVDWGDFAVEGQLMHKVYRWSFCNIAAVDSKGGEGGLFRGTGGEGASDGGTNNKKRRSEMVPVGVGVEGVARPGLRGDDGDEGRYVVLQDMWAAELLSGKLYTRGWVFQERMLAPRLLHFSSTQIFWDCATTSACEVLPDKLPPPLDTVAATERHWREMLLITRDDDDAPPSTTTTTTTNTAVRPPLTRHPTGTADPSLETLWRNAVRKYTACELTNYGSDRLAAIWGVAKLVRDGLRRHDPGEEYGAGLWRVRLEEQLAWRVVGYEKAQRMKELGDKWPSWSWASVRGEIAVPMRFVDRSWRVKGWGSEGGRNGEDGDLDVRFEVGGELGNGDLEPVLVSRRLAVRGVVVQARWKLVGCPMAECRGDCTWSVELDHARNADDGGMGAKLVSDVTGLEAYPDVRPGGDGASSCYLLVLALGSDSSKKKVGEEQHLEDGIGLILELHQSGGQHNEYKRLGTFRVWGVDTQCDELDRFYEFDETAVEDFYLV